MTVCILGNCQAESIYKVLTRRGVKATFFLMNSLLINENGRSIPLYEDHFCKFLGKTKSQLRLYGNISCNPSLDDIEASKPSAIVITMFHDCANYQHRLEKYCIYFNTQIFYNFSEVMNFIRSEFDGRKQITDNYVQHFVRLLELIRDRFPGIEIIVVRRMSPDIFDDTLCFSWVKDWADNYKSITSILFKHCKRLKIQVIDMDDIVLKLQKTGCPPERLFTDHVLIKKKKSGLELFSCRRDIEHASEVLWYKIGDDVQNRLKLASKSDCEHVNQLGSTVKNSLMECLKSTNHHDVFSGVAGLFVKLPENHTQLLIDCNDSMPLGKKDLLMIVRAYFLFNPNALVPKWCDAHREKALEAWNGENNLTLEQQYYLKMLETAKKQNTYFLKKENRRSISCQGKMTRNGFVLTLRGHVPIFNSDYIELTRHAVCPIYLWGAGGRGRAVLAHFLKAGLTSRVIGFIDSNEALDGKIIDGKPVIHYTKTPENNQASVVICTIHEYEVLSILKMEMGFENPIYLSSSFYDDLNSEERLLTIEIPREIAEIPMVQARDCN